MLNSHPNRDELTGQIGTLQSQLMQLDGLRAEASTGTLTQLAALQVGVAVSVGAAHNVTAHATSSAAVEAFQSVIVMSQEQMIALERDHRHHSEQFQQFESDMFTRIDALAAVNGVDVSGFHEKQRQLQAEYNEAKARGDLAGMLEADALRTNSLRVGLEHVGASPAEIDAAREQEEAAQQRYLDQTAIEARREAEQQGMSADAVKEHVAVAVAEADAGLEERKARYAEKTASKFEASFDKPKFAVTEATEADAPLPTPHDQQPTAEVQL